MLLLSDAEVRRKILARVRRLTPDARRRWGRMTPHQMICHLNDSYRTATGEKRAGSRSGFLPPAVMKWVALSTPLPWPKGMKTMPEVEQGSGGTLPVEFERDRDELVSIINDFCSRNKNSLAPAHPLFGPMDHDDWMRWGFLHADHHLRQFGL